MKIIKRGIINLEEIIKFVGIFQLLKDLDFFKTVKINPDWGTIYWENGADLDPDVLYSLITNQSLNDLEKDDLQLI
ncbi:Molybdopterin-guanine dinucleotide biosynthesis protein A like (fragment) [Microcystis aeruginosa PCC 9808]|uniref:Molybdopterin-guanine dinucleotide biosynthesis protein A like n=1 Tax=Microcystis aeruginosa PCC 9808 TaxID=1160284 RepID=I4HWD5_MICAE